MGQIKSYPEQVTLNDSDRFLLQDGTNDATKQVDLATMREKLQGAGLVGWADWVPSFTNLSGGTLTYASYKQIGKTVEFRLVYTLTGANVSGTEVSFTPPVAFNADYASNNGEPVGEAIFVDVSSGIFVGIALWGTGGKINTRVINAAGTYASPAAISSTIPHTWDTGDMILVSGQYEAV